MFLPLVVKFRNVHTILLKHGLEQASIFKVHSAWRITLITLGLEVWKHIDASKY